MHRQSPYNLDGRPANRQRGFRSRPSRPGKILRLFNRLSPARHPFGILPACRSDLVSRYVRLPDGAALFLFIVILLALAFGFGWLGAPQQLPQALRRLEEQVRGILCARMLLRRSLRPSNKEANNRQA